MNDDRLLAIQFGWETPPRSFSTLLPAPLTRICRFIDPLLAPSLRETAPTLRHQVDHWAHQEAARWALGGSAIVLGYCSGAALASELAGRLGAGARLVLVDPTFPTVGDAQELLAELAVAMDPGLDLSQAPDLSGLGGASGTAAAGVFLRSVAERAEPDLPADICDALTEKQHAWVGYTLAVAGHRAPSPPAPDLVLLSAEAELPACCATAPAHRFPVDPAGLFHSAAASTVVAEFVEQHRAAAG